MALQSQVTTTENKRYSVSGNIELNKPIVRVTLCLSDTNSSFSDFTLKLEY